MSLSDYQILGKLGSGSFGIVHKARDKKKGVVCVIKMVDIAKMDNKMKKSAMAEGKILKQMNSPYIVKHFNTFISKSTLNIVMEYCPKGDLTAFMKAQMGKPLKEDIIWKMAIQMMVGLRDLHEKKILHRDIKAMNIFLDGENNVRIGDLGVARVLKTDFAYTVVGTPYYLSPQMCEEKPYNEKTDIWAMGCVIYELCTGKHPFQANNQAALALKIVMGKYEKLPAHYSADLAWVVQTCLSVDYKRRPTASYLLTKPKIMEKAQKLGIIISKDQKIEEKQNIEEVKKQERSEKKQEKQIKRESVQKQIKPSIYDKMMENKQRKLSAAKQHEMEKKNQSNRSFSRQKKNQSKQKQSVQLPKNKKQPIVQKPVIPKPSVNKSSPVKVVKPTKNEPNFAYLNRYIPEDVREKKIIDIEDKKQTQKIYIPDSDSDDEKPKAVKKTSEESQKNDKLMIIQKAQQQVGDDELEEQFGITPSKKQVLVSLEFKKTKTINWDIDEVKQTTMKGQLPTIKTPSHMQPIEEMQVHEPQGDDIEIEEQIEDNQPYISDDESVPEQEQLLIEDYEQQEVDYSKKITENQKRQSELVKLKNHFQGQLLKKIPKEKYQELKQKLTQCSQHEVNEVVKVWNNIETINIFYRIIHFDIEIKRCQSNIEAIKDKLEQVRKNK